MLVIVPTMAIVDRLRNSVGVHYWWNSRCTMSHDCMITSIEGNLLNVHVLQLWDRFIRSWTSLLQSPGEVTVLH